MFLGTHLEGPCSWSLENAGRRPMMDKQLNTEYGLNPANR